MSSYNILNINNNIDFGTNSNDAYSFYVVDASQNNIDIQISNNYWEGVCWEFQRVDNTSNVVTLIAPQDKNINGMNTCTILGLQYCQLIYDMGKFICHKTNTTL